MEIPQEQLEAETIKKRMAELDTKAERNLLIGLEKEEWAKISSRLTKLEKLACMDIKQKARIKWLIDGDENTQFFHGFVKNRNRKNHMNGLMINGVWSNQPDEMKAEIFRFFSSKFKEKWKHRPEFRSSKFKTISTASREFLEGSILSLIHI